MYEIAYGSRYDQKLTVTEIAALIRKEIKDLVKRGSLPQARYSVRTQKYSGGASIRIQVTLAGVWQPCAEDNCTHHVCNSDLGRQRVLSPTAAEADTILQRLLDAYNFDGSESQIDYFYVNYYSHVYFEEEGQ